MSNKQTFSLIVENTLMLLEEKAALTSNYVLTDEDLLSLHSLFGATLERALEILDRPNSVTIYTVNEGKRKLIEVKSDSDFMYRLFHKINYCSCPGFKHQVIEKKCEITCKHVVASRIAEIINKYNAHNISQSDYLVLLNSMFDV